MTFSGILRQVQGSGDGLRQNLLKELAGRSLLLQRMSWYLNCQSSGLGIRIVGLGWNGDLDRYQSIRVGDDQLLAGS